MSAILPYVCQGPELIYVVPPQNRFQAAEAVPTTAALIAALGGGGGLTGSDIIVSGNSVNASTGFFYGWNSATTGNKIINAPQAIGSLGIIESADMFGNAGTYPIVFTPSGTDQIIGGQDQIYTNDGSARWRDIAVGLWVNV